MANQMFAGTQATSTTGAALNNGNSRQVAGVTISNHDATINIFVGNSTSQSIIVKPLERVTIQANDIKKVFVKSASGTPTVGWLAWI